MRSLAAPDADRPPARRSSTLHRLRRTVRTAGGFTILFVVVSLPLMMTVDLLNDWSDARRRAEVMMTDLQLDTAELVAAKHDVLDHPGDLAAVAAYDVQRDDLSVNVAALDGSVDDAEWLTWLAQAYDSLDLALAYQEVLLADGRFKQARVMDEQTVQPVFTTFDTVLKDASVEVAADAVRFRRIAHVGLYVAVVLAWFVVGGLSWRYQTAWRGSQRSLRHSRERFRTLAESAFEGVAVVSDGRVVEASDAFTSILRYDAREAQGLDVTDLVTPEARKDVRLSLLGDDEALLEVDGLRKDGTVVRLELRTRQATYHDRPVQILAVRDVTERKALEAELQHQALHDALTGLANRTLFADRLEHALLRRCQPEAAGVAVLFFDLDDFKVVNDSLGHHAGDQMLLVVAQRMRESLRPEDTVARLGGDEFAVLIEDLCPTEAEAHAVEVAARIREAFIAAPVALGEGGHAFPVASVGIALGAAGVDSPERLLREADLAMYEAKAEGKGRHAVFVPGLEARVENRMRLGNDLRGALERGELAVHYQPQVDLGTGRIEGVEALLRWSHPERGAVPPLEFIPIAEQSGLIVPIGLWVLEQACHQVAAWQRRYDGAADLSVSVNLSAHQLNDAALSGHISAVLASSGLAPRHLTLEITESALLADTETVTEGLSWIRDLGVRLAIDDFGTGYSSLSYLRRLSSDYLKIDRSFIEELGDRAEDRSIVDSIIGLATSLGITCVAEGVEDAGQRDHLRSIGCELAQGFYFHRPASAAATEDLLARQPQAVGLHLVPADVPARDRAPGPHGGSLATLAVPVVDAETTVA